MTVAKVAFDFDVDLMQMGGQTISGKGLGDEAQQTSLH